MGWPWLDALLVHITSSFKQENLFCLPPGRSMLLGSSWSEWDTASSPHQNLTGEDGIFESPGGEGVEAVGGEVPMRGEVLRGPEAAATNGFGQREVTGDTADLSLVCFSGNVALHSSASGGATAHGLGHCPRGCPRSKAGAPCRRPAGDWPSTRCCCSGRSGSPSTDRQSRCPRACDLGLGLGSQGGQGSSAQLALGGVSHRE